ncbi:hypothetical protein [Acidocella sp.]|uniref:hypothetical protein n=1 Tax=Acidocella sp. TaxID=50710 RepID=UPI002609B72B|nr:hypothetical protein [Acidocella sp.]
MKRACPTFLAWLFFLVQTAQAAPYRGPFTGLFYGQGRSCWGGLFIGTRTLTWDKQFTPCARTSYTIRERDLHWPFENYDHIVFQLNHVSKACITPIIGLYYYKPLLNAAGQSEDQIRLYYDWQVVGFATEALYRKFPARGFMDGSQTIDHGVYVDCPLPFAEKPFPFGSPSP